MDKPADPATPFAEVYQSFLDDAEVSSAVTGLPISGSRLSAGDMTVIGGCANLSRVSSRPQPITRRNRRIEEPVSSVDAVHRAIRLAG